LSIGTMFTLLVVPAFYMVLARRHAQDVVSEVRGTALHPQGVAAE
jgi:hypothetical protein